MRAGRSIGLCAVLFTLLDAQVARAELSEKVVGLRTALSIPSFSGELEPQFAGVAWGFGGLFEYGILHDLWVGVRTEYMPASGARSDFTVSTNGRSQTGTLAFDGHFLELVASVRFKIFAGYNLAPHVWAGIGGVLGVLSNLELLDDSQRLITTPQEFVEARPIVEAGLDVDYRLLNLVTIGIGVRYSMTLVGDVYGGRLTIPLTVSYFWF